MKSSPRKPVLRFPHILPGQSIVADKLHVFDDLFQLGRGSSVLFFKCTKNWLKSKILAVSCEREINSVHALYQT